MRWPGDTGLPPEAEREEVAACGARPWRQGNGAPGYDGGYGVGNVKGAGMAPAAPPAWAFQHKYGQLRVWASSLRERPLAVLLLALLAQCMPRQLVEFLMILGGLALAFLGGTDSGAVGQGAIQPFGRRWF